MKDNKLNQYVKERQNELIKISKVRRSETDRNRRDKMRADADIDYARILYSSSFRRLQGKMQLLVPGQIHFYRNRLTHSLEVSQIARSIAKRIGMEDTLTVQACALAHDIGNPPFGHAGEVFLSECDPNFSYEGNAQSFRTLNHIEDKFYDCNGLNLTLRTLLGVVKYPFNKAQNPKKFLYDEDYNLVLKWASKYKFNFRTIDCEVMDLSDEIAYAAHDLEDALRMKFFTIDDLLYEFEKSEFSGCFEVLQNIVVGAKKFANKAHAYKTSEEYSILLLRELTSSIVNLLVTDIGLIKQEDKLTLGYQKYKCIAHGLKKLTFEAVKRRPDIIRYELMGRKVLQGLYNVYSDISFNKGLVLLPAEYRDNKNRERTILDYIGGMTDYYAIDQYKVYFGGSSLDNLYTQDFGKCLVTK